MTGPLLLLLLFLLTIAHLVSLKVCSVTVDHRTAPLFISGWTLLGLLISCPVFGHLLPEGAAAFMAAPALLLLAAFKGALLWFLLVASQSLMKESLSSRHYVTPLSVGLIAGVNSFLGEKLSTQQWLSALGLCLLSAGFFFKGHLSTLSQGAKRDYALLVAISVILAAVDQAVLKSVNWYAYTLATNLVLLALALTRAGAEIARTALLHKSAALAGSLYAATELVKMYQQVAINPVTAVVTVQAVTKPVILVLSALVWKERTVREQLAWGLAAFALVTLPMAWPVAHQLFF